ncbi:MAG: ECF-type sigma factor [Bryobacteraceae bacterium]|nr:ECF-type sigma factor [Bryobacteraceae bacterium]
MFTSSLSVDCVYPDLRRLARAFLRRERGGHTLQPTALVHEAYLRLNSQEPVWQNREHFFGAAVNTMRQILIQHARARKARKRGGEAERVPLRESILHAPSPNADLAVVNEALRQLAAGDPTLLQVVELRCFEGLTVEQIAARTGRSVASVKRDWAYARAWLRSRLSRRGSACASLRP